MIEVVESEHALKIGRRALRDSFLFDLKDLSQFEVKLLKNGDELVGTVFYKGPEVHVAILQKHRKRWISRRIIKEILNIPFSNYGYAVTMSFEKDRDFLERIGFKEQSKINDVIYYRIIPWV